MFEGLKIDENNKKLPEGSDCEASSNQNNDVQNSK